MHPQPTLGNVLYHTTMTKDMQRVKVKVLTGWLIRKSL